MRLVVSPHFDDAVLGCGSWLAATDDPALTVFAGIPARPDVTPYDAACGFESSAEAMAARAAEDECAMGMLGRGRSFTLSHLDSQYGQVGPKPTLLAVELVEQMRAFGCEGLVGPLGIQHPDHVRTSDACLIAADEGVPTWLYEELPYRVVWPEAASARLRHVDRRSWRLVPDFLGGGEIEAKEKALTCYVSQQLDPHCCLVPERFWRLVPR